jgi:hypothetical protein
MNCIYNEKRKLNYYTKIKGEIPLNNILSDPLAGRSRLLAKNCYKTADGDQL